MIQTRTYPSNEWNTQFAEIAHAVVFDEKRPKEMNRLDFAIICYRDADPLTYVTCREFDSESVYMQYGGAFPSARGTTLSFSCYKKILEELADLNYKRATTLIENENIPMLKFAFKAGFRIIGVRLFEGQIFCELLKNFKSDVISERTN